MGNPQSGLHRREGSMSELDQVESTTPPITDDTDEHLSGLFGRDSLYLLLWALQLGLAALVTPIATRLLGVEPFGQVVAANAVMQVMFVFVCLNLSTGIQRRYFDSGLESARKLVTLSVVVAVVITAAVALTGNLWAKSLGFSGYTLALRYAVLWAGVSGVTASILALLRTQDRLRPFSVVSLLQSVVAEATSLLLVALVAPTAANFIVGQLLAQCAATLIGLCWVRPAWLGRLDFALVNTTLRYTVPLVPAALSALALNSADRLILQRQLGETQVARYQIAYNVGSMPILLLSVLNSVWMPRFFALDVATNRSKVLSAARDALFRLLIPVMIGLSLGAPLVLRLWAPSSYRPGRLLIVLFIVVVSTIPCAAGLSSTRALLMTGHTGSIAVAALLAAAANIGLNIVMISHYGLAGAAAATLISYILLYVLLELRARVELPVKPVSLRIGAGLAASAAICWALALPPQTDVVLVVRGVAAAGCLVWFARLAWGLARTSSPDEAELGSELGAS